MAEYLASIFGTEKDRVNCPFYFKIGACCHGVQFTEEAVQKHFDDFFADIYCELEEKYGHIEELNVCENLGDHLIGNVYCKFRKEEDAQKAVDALNNRWYNGAPIYAELSPVTDFREASCRQHELSVKMVQHFTDWGKGGRGGRGGGGGGGGRGGNWGSRGGGDRDSYRDRDRDRSRRH